MNTEIYHRSLPLLAAALSDQRGIKVEIGGSHAYTDGKLIHIPAISIEADEKLLNVARAYLSHECAHVLLSEFEALKKAQLSQLAQFFSNCVEDLRIETRMTELYPGCAIQFREAAKHVFIEKAEPYDPVFAVPNYVLLRLRRSTCPELAGRVAQATLDVTKHFPGLLPKLELIFADLARSFPASTQEAIAYGKRFAALLQDYDEEQRAQQENAGNGGDASQDDDSNGEKSAVAETNDDDTTAESLAPLFADDVADKLPTGLGEALSEELESSRSNDPYDGFATAVEVPANFNPMPPSMLEKTVRLQASLRPALVGCLQADTYEGRMPSQHGRLNTRNLYKAFLGDPHVFMKNVPARLTSTAIHILVDRSGSTTAFAHDIAVSSFAVASAAARIRGVSVGMSVFPVSYPGERDQPGVSTLIRHGQTAPRYVAFDASGCTPLAEAIWHVLPTLMRQREPRKILLISTDGCPDCVAKAEAALRDAAHVGVEVYGISFRNTSIVSLLGEQRSVVIQEIDELPHALSTMLLTALRQAA